MVSWRAGLLDLKGQNVVFVFVAVVVVLVVLTMIMVISLNLLCFTAP